MLTCLKCMSVETPEIIVIERNPRAPLCDVHGTALVNVVERMDFVPTEEQLEGYYAGQQEVKVVTESEEAEEDTEPPIYFPGGITATFEEVDQMNSAELAILAEKLGITFKEGEFIDTVREAIKKVLV